ncbi:MAG: ATP-binding protein [Deltaproteobacteria bacterium]|nr:ATP-binding protein [Deltaproteobacteria bacterium]
MRSSVQYHRLLRSLLTCIQQAVGPRLFPRRAVWPTTLALIEAVNNAICHAHRGMTSLPIVLNIKLSARKIVMEVKDQGRGIPKEKLKHLHLVKPEAMHGRGLWLIHHEMDRVISKRNNNGHSLIMTWAKEK